MIRNYRDLTRWEMEQVDRENTIVLIPLGALEQHGNQAPLGTDDIIAEAMSQEIKKALGDMYYSTGGRGGRRLPDAAVSGDSGGLKYRA